MLSQIHFQTPLISICVPIYNVEKYIEKCSLSLFRQTYGNIEYIFVNDNSSDMSIEILEHVMSQFPVQQEKTRIISHSKNRGLAAARNTAIEHANGEFIMHVDSDDWLELDAVELLVRQQQITEADIVSGKAIAHYADHEELLEEPQYANKNKMMQYMSMLTYHHVMWKRLIRRSLYIDNDIKAVEGVNIGEDHHTLPRLIYYAKKCVELDEVVYHYNCMNRGSYMKDQSEKMQNERFRSNLTSIDILLDFFRGKDELCVQQLNDLRTRFLFKYSSSLYFSLIRRKLVKAMQRFTIKF